MVNERRIGKLYRGSRRITLFHVRERESFDQGRYLVPYARPWRGSRHDCRNDALKFRGRESERIPDLPSVPGGCKAWNFYTDGHHAPPLPGYSEIQIHTAGARRCEENKRRITHQPDGSSFQRY